MGSVVWDNVDRDMTVKKVVQIVRNRDYVLPEPQEKGSHENGGRDLSCFAS